MTEDAAPPFRPGDILAVLERHAVDYIVIGGLAAVWHGAAHVTTDIDITPRRDPSNLGRLSDALRELDARVRIESGPAVPFDHDAASLERSSILNLSTTAGNLDITAMPSGTTGYPDLNRDAVQISVHGARPRVASLADVIRSKEAADRPKDRLALPVLRRLLEQQGSRNRS